jgi:hypothetical protein
VRGVAGGVVVYEDKGVSAVDDGRAKDFAGMGQAFVERSSADVYGVEPAKARVEKNGAENFLMEYLHIEAGAKNGLRIVHFLVFGLLDDGPGGYAESGNQSLGGGFGKVGVNSATVARERFLIDPKCWSNSMAIV